MPGSVWTRTQMTLENSSVRSVSIDVIFTAILLPSQARAAPSCCHSAPQHGAGTGRSLTPACNISQHVLGISPTRRRPATTARAEGRDDMATRKRALEVVRNDDGEAKPSRRNRLNFFELAYQRIEELLVHCELKPGQFMTMLELQHITGFGRTPVHHAVNRLSADTLIIIRPRHGLRIAPIDLARERMLLALRRDMERFVIRLAPDRASLSHRNQALHIERLLR